MPNRIMLLCDLLGVQYHKRRIKQEVKRCPRRFIFRLFRIFCRTWRLAIFFFFFFIKRLPKCKGQQRQDNSKIRNMLDSIIISEGNRCRGPGNQKKNYKIDPPSTRITIILLSFYILMSIITDRMACNYTNI